MRTYPAPTLGLAIVVLLIASACSSMSPEDEEFIRRHRWFFDGHGRQEFRNNPDVRERLRRFFHASLQEEVRPDYLQSVRRGQVDVGMTRREVLYTLGSPEVTTSTQVENRISEWFEYNIAGDRRTLALEAGLLVEILSHKRTPLAQPGGGPR